MVRDAVGLARIVAGERLVATRWLVVLEQAEWWTPREAFEAWVVAPMGATLDQTPGLVRVCDMSPRYRRHVVAFMWRRSRGLAAGLATMGLMMAEADASELALDMADAEDSWWSDLVENEGARRRWFDGLPLVKALRDG